MAKALIGLGGNVGDVRDNLDLAVTLFCDGSDVRLLAKSAHYRTPAWGITDQPPFVNLCVMIATQLAPRPLLDRALAVERQLGRDRTNERRWGPRPVDIDLLVYDRVVVDEPGLTLPHPRLLARAFVMVPLGEIASDWVVDGVKIKDGLARLLAQGDAEGIERLPARHDDPAADQ